MEKNSENIPYGSNIGFDRPETLYGIRNSPARVKRNFDLPPVSNIEIKEEANALGKELKKPCPPRKCNKRKHSPYFTRLKHSNETPMKSLAYCRPIKLLKATSGKSNKNEVENDEAKASMSLKVVEDNNEDNNRSSPDMFENGSSEKSSTSKPIENPDLFDDFLNECSQEVEEKVNVQDIPKQYKELSHKLTTEEHYARSGITKRPKKAKRKSLSIVKEAISGKTNRNEAENDEVKASMSLKVTEDNNRSSPDMFEGGSSEKSGTSKPIENSDLFDDFLNVCSQEVEEKVNVQDIPKQDKELSHKLTTEEHYARSGITKTPKTANRKSLSKEFKYTPRNLSFELDETDNE